uniref:ribosomal protein L2 n=1 Tax=Prosopanche panguanensis TaxID=2952649 RepID=UPI002113DBF9|nr:ribosomal protein L2 [Prosopanche panguanensis]USN93714.1 ribosomal protein L2 [Prosopanche panguanensis]
MTLNNRYNKKFKRNLLIYGYNFNKGRNYKGTITVKHRGGGHKRLYRNIDFKRNEKNTGKILTIEYDPNRNTTICLVYYKLNNLYKYIIHPQNVGVGDTILSSHETPIYAGNTLPLINIPFGTFIHNIEIKPGKGGQLVRAAGTAAKVIKKIQKRVVLKLPSGKLCSRPLTCLATIGQVNKTILKKKIKAGTKRWLGKRPKVRGTAMNPVDHPHGGGEGKAPIGRKFPATPWGYPAFGRRKKKEYFF